MRHILKSEILGGALLCRVLIIAVDLGFIYALVIFARKLFGSGESLQNVINVFGTLALIFGWILITRIYFMSGLRCIPYYSEKYKISELASKLDGEVFESIESDSAVVRAVTKVSENWVKICSKYFPKNGIVLIEQEVGRHSVYYRIIRNDGVKYTVEYHAPIEALIMFFWDSKIIDDLSTHLGIKTKEQIVLAQLPDKGTVSPAAVAGEKRKILTDEDSITPGEKTYLEKEIRPIIENNLERDKKSLVALGRYIYGMGRSGCFKFKGYWFVYEVDEYNACVIDGLFDVKEAAYILVASALDMPGAFPKDKIPEESGLYKSFYSLDEVEKYITRNKNKLIKKNK